MPITRTGSLFGDVTTDTGANTGGFNVTVPADAEIMIALLTCYFNATNFISGVVGGITIGGDAMTPVAADGDTSAYMGSLFYKVSPKTGTQAFAWDFVGTSDPAQCTFECGFYKGINIASAIRDTDGKQFAGTPYTSKTLTVVSGDFIVGAASISIAGTSNGFTGATEVLYRQNGHGAAVEIAWGENSSPSGNQTIAWSQNNTSDGALMAIVLKPASATTPISLGGAALTDDWAS